VIRATGVGLAAVLLAPPAAATDHYVLDAARSEIRVHVGKAGLFKFAGHEHEIVGVPESGRVVADRDRLGSSSVSLRLRASDFHVRAGSESADDSPKIERTMAEEVLQSALHPTISFESTSVSGQETAKDRYRLEVLGTLRLHGMEQSLTLPVEVVVEGDTLVARGRMTIRHDSFGLKRISVAGVVKVANDIAIDFTLVAAAEKP
jgi:polyisoprenoid-binding protein YceI